MPDFPMVGASRFATAGAVSASSAGTSLTPSTNAESAYTQLIASTTFDAQGVLVSLKNAGATAQSVIDLAIGGAGSEVNIANDLIISGRVNMSVLYYLPIAIPAGTRLSVRGSRSAASASVRVECLLVGQGFSPSAPLGRCTTYGGVVSPAGGISIDPGGSANTEGSWTQITASTTSAISALIIGIGGQGNDARASYDWLLDIGIGAGGSEVVLIPDLALSSSNGHNMVVPQSIGPIPCSIPAGTRLSVRAQCSGTDATDRLFDVILYGID
jgi:hypothetical protein